MAPPTDASEYARFVDEHEQLRTALESALDDNAELVEERDRLRERLQTLSAEMRENQATLSQREERSNWLEPAYARQGETGEELRVAFEELQVLTEELEVANTGLQQTNQELDARVAQRTRQLKEINDALRATEASLRAIADLVPDLLWRTSAVGRADWFNQRWLAYTGLPSDALLDAGWMEAIHPDDVCATRETWDDAIAGGEPFDSECRIRDASGRYRWFLVRAEPLRDDKNRVVRWFAAGADIHDQRMALEALQRSEARFRSLAEGMPQLVWRAVGTGAWTWASPQWTAYTGQSEQQALDGGWLDAFHPDDRRRAEEAWERADDEHRMEFGARLFHASEGRYRHFRTRASAVLGARGEVIEWLGTSTDVDDILQLQEEQEVLVAELQHRTRNLMAVVQAVTARTMRGVDSLAAFKEQIDDRFAALARVQGLLSQRDTGARIPFDLLLRDELSAHIELTGQALADKIALEGPPGIPLRSATVQTFALALHELATNAVKHGALSGRGGRLRVAWGLKSDADGAPALWVDWLESGVEGVSEVAAASGMGYGRELIERALPYQLGAKTTYEVVADGVHCTIEVGVPDQALIRRSPDG